MKNTKFLRQYRIYFNYKNEIRFFIADFYCAIKELIIELDGDIYSGRQEEDLFRENIIKELNYKIIRFNNEEIINNIVEVIKKINELNPLSVT